MAGANRPKSIDMAKQTKKPPKRDQYREILSIRGINFNDCKVIAFIFKYPMQCRMFHFGLMEVEIEYIMFDSWEKHANVIIRKEQNDAAIIALAEKNGGTKTIANLL